MEDTGSKQDHYPVSRTLQDVRSAEFISKVRITRSRENEKEKEEEESDKRLSGGRKKVVIKSVTVVNQMINQKDVQGRGGKLVREPRRHPPSIQQ